MPLDVFNSKNICLEQEDTIKAFNLTIDKYIEIEIRDDYCFGHCFEIIVFLDQLSTDWEPNFVPLASVLDVNTKFLTKAIKQVEAIFPDDKDKIVAFLTTYQSDAICLYAYLPLQEHHKQILKDYYENNIS